MADVDERTLLGTRIALAARQWRRVVNTRLSAYALTEATWLPLLRLSRSAVPMRQKDLAAALELDSSSVVRILSGLEAAGLVERREHEGDRRAKTIVLTEEGRRRVAEVEAVARDVREAVLAPLSQREIADANRALSAICDTLADLNAAEATPE